MGEAVPVFLYTLLAVRDILVDFDHLCLKHYPVGLQPRQHIDKVRLGLCGREADFSSKFPRVAKANCSSAPCSAQIALV